MALLPPSTLSFSMAVSTSFCPTPLAAPRAAVHDSHLNAAAVPFPLTTRINPHPLLRSSPAPPPLHIVCGRNPRAEVVTLDSWENSIVKSDLPVLVEFYASWCGPCKMVHRVIDEIAVEYDGRLNCFVLNTDTDLEIAEEHEIKAVPVVMLFKNGEKCETVVGTMPKEFYVAAVERIIQ